MRARFLVPVLLLAVGIFVACGNSQDKVNRMSKAERQRLDSLDREALKIGVMPTLDCLPIYVAKEYHLFDTLGVDVHLRWYSAQMDCDTALTNKRVEGSITDLVRAERMCAKGTKLSYSISTGTYWQLIANKRARITELKQLSDKMIAMTRFSATDYLTNVALDSVRPKYDVYRVQINDVNIRLKMLLNNEMDAALLAEPQATRARMEGNPVLMDSRDKNLWLGVVAFRSAIFSDKKRVKQHKAFLKAYNMAVDSINKNGVGYYAPLLEKKCGVPANALSMLPKMKFKHATAPRARDVEIAVRANSQK